MIMFLPKKGEISVDICSTLSCLPPRSQADENWLRSKAWLTCLASFIENMCIT